MAAAGVPVPEGLYQRLLAVSDSLGGLDDQTVRQLIDKVWGAMEEEMRVAGITHQDVTTAAALGRHSAPSRACTRQWRLSWLRGSRGTPWRQQWLHSALRQRMDSTCRQSYRFFRQLL